MEIKVTPEELRRAMQKVHEWTHKVAKFSQANKPITFGPLTGIKTGRFSSKGPNLANVPTLPTTHPMKVVAGRMQGKIQLTSVKVNRDNLKRALYGKLYGSPTSALGTPLLDIVVMPPDNIQIGYEEVCLSGCSQQLRCAAGHNVPVVCHHCRSVATFLRQVYPWIKNDLRYETTYSEEEQLKVDLCDPDDTVPSACPLFLNSVVICPRCNEGCKNPIRAVREQVRCWPRKRRQRSAQNGRYIYRHNTLYLYGEPEGPTHTFKEWAVRCTGKGRGTLHERQRQRFARQTERKKLGKDEKQQQTRRRSSRRSRNGKKAQR